MCRGTSGGQCGGGLGRWRGFIGKNPGGVDALLKFGGGGPGPRGMAGG